VEHCRGLGQQATRLISSIGIGKRDDMVTVTCTDDTCPNGNIPFNVLGNPPFVECGGCHVHLEPYDERDDPPAPELPA